MGGIGIQKQLMKSCNRRTVSRFLKTYDKANVLLPYSVCTGIEINQINGMKESLEMDLAIYNQQRKNRLLNKCWHNQLSKKCNDLSLFCIIAKNKFLINYKLNCKKSQVTAYMVKGQKNQTKLESHKLCISDYMKPFLRQTSQQKNAKQMVGQRINYLLINIYKCIKKY